jgi:cytochrome c-type biogenesis protein
MIAAGLAIATGEMTRLAVWILEAFPWLARLG